VTTDSEVSPTPSLLQRLRIHVIWSWIVPWLIWRLCRNTGRAVLIRHAEPLSGGSDPGLSSGGFARANELVRVLGDAGVTKIVVSQLQRTQQTAAPIAGHLGLTPVAVPATDVGTIADHVRSGLGLVLVVGHSNTVPDVINSLAGTSMPDLPHDEFDHLFVVQYGAVAHLRYGYA
jgi:broad specificity phosphatase PhoE